MAITVGQLSDYLRPPSTSTGEQMATTASTVSRRSRIAAAAAAPRSVDVEALDGSAAAQEFAGAEAQLYASTRRFLGGERFSRQDLSSRLDVHAAIVDGVSYASLTFLVSKIKCIKEGDVAKVLGISTRSLRRQSETPEKLMPPVLGSKSWALAETLAKATTVFGGEEEAERWMSKPAMGLNGNRPIDLLETVQGAELVSDFLVRLDYGVYS